VFDKNVNPTRWSTTWRKSRWVDSYE